MTTNGYIVNALLVLLVVRQLRERRLDLRSLVLPVALVGWAAAMFLHTIPTAGDDLVLMLVLAAAGAAMGAAAGLTTHLRVGDDGVALGRAGFVAAGLWIAGVGARMAFAYAAGHGLGPAIRSFSLAHGITGSQAWVAALVLMALADVATRLGVLQVRAHNVVSLAQSIA